MNFINVEPTLENYWRAIILFGKNTASYKFALAKSLIDVSLERNSDLITLDDLALPYAMNLCEHLKHSPKQASFKKGRWKALKQKLSYDFNDKFWLKEDHRTDRNEMWFNIMIK